MGPERLNELMTRADYVIVAAALTPATRGMVGAEQFACSKEGQVGGWVDGCWGVIARSLIVDLIFKTTLYM